MSKLAGKIRSMTLLRAAKSRRETAYEHLASLRAELLKLQED